MHLSVSKGWKRVVLWFTAALRKAYHYFFLFSKKCFTMTLNDELTYIYIYIYIYSNETNYFLFVSITPSPFDNVFKWHSCVCKCSVTQSCPILCDPMDCSPPGSSVHGIFQARTLEWVAISYSRGYSQLRDRTCVSCVSYIDRQILYHWATWEALQMTYIILRLQNELYHHTDTK